MENEISPNDSRYIPLTQQKSCCAPTCLQMVMYKNNIPLIPAEKIGYELGLVVSPEDKYFFYNVRTSEERPPAGYGTRIYLPEFEPNKALKKLGINLKLTVNSISNFIDANQLLEYLIKAEKEDSDLLLCFNSGIVNDEPDKSGGHLCVFDRIIDGQIRFIDPSPNRPKWRLINPDKMFNAMKDHGEKRSAGVWEIKSI